jgi:hypothetical protein
MNTALGKPECLKPACNINQVNGAPETQTVAVLLK